jgi:hypothetical protein
MIDPDMMHEHRLVSKGLVAATITSMHSIAVEPQVLNLEMGAPRSGVLVGGLFFLRVVGAGPTVECSEPSGTALRRTWGSLGCLACRAHRGYSIDCWESVLLEAVRRLLRLTSSAQFFTQCNFDTLYSFQDLMLNSIQCWVGKALIKCFGFHLGRLVVVTD